MGYHNCDYGQSNKCFHFVRRRSSYYEVFTEGKRAEKEGKEKGHGFWRLGKRPKEQWPVR